jgi:hypothetical protein
MDLSREDIQDIQQVQALYGHAADFPDQSMLEKVFAKDAVFDGRLAGGEYQDGLAAIIAWFGEGKPPHAKVHNMMNVWVFQEKGQVNVKAKWLVRDQRDGNIQMGDYEDIMERTPHGWRIKHRVVIARDPELPS